MRHYILTDDDRKRLLVWLETGEEDQMTSNLFSLIRKCFPRLVDDMRLLLQVRRKLVLERRWRGRIRVPDGFKDSILHKRVKNR